MVCSVHYLRITRFGPHHSRKPTMAHKSLKKIRPEQRERLLADAIKGLPRNNRLYSHVGDIRTRSLTTFLVRSIVLALFGVPRPHIADAVTNLRIGGINKDFNVVGPQGETQEFFAFQFLHTAVFEIWYG